MIKEICVESYVEAVEGEKRGANRVELCDNLAQGGTTPSYGTIKKTIRDIKIPTFVIIRPRGGNFVYSDEEFEIMKEDIKICKELGVKGIVTGILDRNNHIDYVRLKVLVDLAKPMEITFHKAIDEVENPVKEIKQLVELGIDRILTSGTKATALEGKEIINSMIKEAGDKIKIVVAGGVTIDNFQEVRECIPNEEYHGRKII